MRQKIIGITRKVAAFQVSIWIFVKKWKTCAFELDILYITPDTTVAGAPYIVVTRDLWPNLIPIRDRLNMVLPAKTVTL